MRHLWALLAGILIGHSSWAPPNAKRLVFIYNIEIQGEPRTAVVVMPAQLGLGYSHGFSGVHSSLSLDIVDEGQRFGGNWQVQRSQMPPGFEVVQASENQVQRFATSLLSRFEKALYTTPEYKSIFNDAKDPKGEFRNTLTSPSAEGFLHPMSAMVAITTRVAPPVVPEDPSKPILYRKGKLISMTRQVPLAGAEDLAPEEHRLLGTKVEGRFPRPSEQPETFILPIWSESEDPQSKELGFGRRTILFEAHSNTWPRAGTVSAKSFWRLRGETVALKAAIEIALAHGHFTESTQKLSDPNLAIGLAEKHHSGLLMWPGPPENILNQNGQVIAEVMGKARMLWLKPLGFVIERDFKDPQLRRTQTFWMVAPMNRFLESAIGHYLGESHQIGSGRELNMVFGTSQIEPPDGCLYLFAKINSS